jgi:peptidoglycan/xylan/chitin deacetylase (PgdA/CDA1 family)
MMPAERRIASRSVTCATMKTLFRLLFAGISLLLLLLVVAFFHSRSWERALFIDPIYKMDAAGKVIALTFDDGPSTHRTPPLLELLQAHDVKATFFMLGENIEKHPDIARQVWEAGHLIGNHSYDHPRLILRSPAFVKKQILDTDRLIMSLGQAEVRYFRPPYSYKYLVLPWMLRSMEKHLVTGTYDPPAEYASPYPAETVAEEVVRNARPGSIIFLHDGKNADPEAFIQSIASIIVRLKAAGYRFVRLDEDRKAGY